MGLNYISIKLKLCLFCCLAIQSVFGNMLVFRGLGMVKGPVEGIDKKGHAIVMEKLGMIGDKIYGIPVYAYWSSESGISSTFLGYGWRLPIAESRIVPVNAERFEMHRPDGGVELIVRDRKDKNKLRGRRYWKGEIRDEEIRIYTTKDCRHGQCELVFRKGRLVRFKDGSVNATFSYCGRNLESIDVDRKMVMRISRMKGKSKGWQIEFESRKVIKATLGDVDIPLASGNGMRASALTEIVFPDGAKRNFAYGVDADGNGTMRTADTGIVWDAKRRTIVAKDDWRYEVKAPEPEWNNVPIRRFNKKGEVESEHYDLKTGIKTTERGREKTVMRLFTSGVLKGMARWMEYYRNGELQSRDEYSYDEAGRMIYSKLIGRFPYSMDGKEGMKETWYAPNGQLLKIRKNGDNAKVEEYIHTPEGRRVAVICGDKIIAECVGNAKDFVAWHKAKQNGEDLPVPKVIEWRDMPLPEHLRKAIPPDLLKELRNDGW